MAYSAQCSSNQNELLGALLPRFDCNSQMLERRGMVLEIGTWPHAIRGASSLVFMDNDAGLHDTMEVEASGLTPTRVLARCSG